MSSGEDWLLRPVLRGMFKYESLLDGTLSLLDVAMCNEMIDVFDENSYRMQEAMKDA